ncbi:MAG: hypothetical protein ACOCOG_07985 [Prevotella sp.]
MSKLLLNSKAMDLLGDFCDPNTLTERINLLEEIQKYLATELDDAKQLVRTTKDSPCSEETKRQIVKNYQDLNEMNNKIADMRQELITIKITQL